MKKKYIPILLSFLFLLICSTPVSAATGKIHSLSLSTLSVTKNSQEAFYWLMCNNKLSGYSVSKKDQHAYYSESLTSSQLDRLLDNAFASSTSNDLNFFYFTGHTIFENVNPISGPLGINLNVNTHSWYGFYQLAQKLNRYKGQMIVILDTCGSEAFITDGVKKLSDQSHISVICSCGYLKESEFGYIYTNPYLWVNGYRYNGFTYALGKGLGFFQSDRSMKADKNKNGSVSIQELYKYISAYTFWYTQPQNNNTKMFSKHPDRNIFSSQQTSITLSSSSLSLYKNKTATLKATIKGTAQKPSWCSSNQSVAVVNANGKITAKSKGTAVITCTVNGVSAKCTVTVKNPASVKISLNKTKTSVTAGSSVTLKATITGTSSKVSWSSSNSKIAKVKNGKVTGLKPGTAKITAKVNGKKASCTITVKKKSSSAATLYKAFLKKGTFQIPYSYSVGGRKYTSYTTMQIQSFAYVDTNGDKKPELYVRAYKKGENPSYARDYLITCKNNRCTPVNLEERLTGYYKNTKVMVAISYSYLYNGPSTPYTKEVEYFYNTKRAYSAQHYLRTGNVVYRKYTSSYIAELRSSREFYSWYRTNANNGKGYQTFVFYSNTTANRNRIR